MKIEISLDQDDIAMIEDYAAQKGITVEAVTRAVVQDWLAAERTPFARKPTYKDALQFSTQQFQQEG